MPIRPVAEILSEALENGAEKMCVDRVRTAIQMADGGQYLAKKQLRGALTNLENAGIDPADIRSLYARAAQPKKQKPASTTASGKSTTETADDDIAYWAATARGELPEPFGELSAQAIESCGERSKRNAKLIPGAPGRRLLESIGQSEEWLAAPPTDRAAVIGLLADAAGMLQRVVDAALGRPNNPPAPLPGTDDDGPKTLADVKPADKARVIAAGVLFAGKLGLIHGPAGGGKTTALANAVARITTGAAWMGEPTTAGAVVVVTEDPDTWRAVVAAAGGNLARVHLRPWSGLAEATNTLKPVAAVIDTLQHVAHAIGADELDSARAVDQILRPLVKLCREHETGIAVLDHEPWAESGSGAETKKRPRHSGAKVATVDYLIRCSLAGGATALDRGMKVRRGIDIPDVAHVNINGQRAAVTTPPDAAAASMDRDTIVSDPDAYAAVLDFLRRHPETWQSMTAIKTATKLTGRRFATLQTTLDQLVAARRVERQPGPRKSVQYRPVATGSGSAKPAPPEPSEPVDRFRPVTPMGTDAEPVAEPVPGTGSDPIGEPVGGTGSRNRFPNPEPGTGQGTPSDAVTIENEAPRPPAGPAGNPPSSPPAGPPVETAGGEGAVTVEELPGPPLPDDPAAVTAIDIFARGAELRRRWAATEKKPDGPDGPLPVKIRDWLLSEDPEQRRAGMRRRLLDHDDGGAAGRPPAGLTLPERAAFMNGLNEP